MCKRWNSSDRWGQLERIERDHLRLGLRTKGERELYHKRAGDKKNQKRAHRQTRQSDAEERSNSYERQKASY